MKNRHPAFVNPVIRLGMVLLGLSLLACNGAPAGTQPDPQPTVDINTSPVSTEATPTPAPTPTPLPQAVSTLALNAIDLPLSPYYPVEISLYKGPLERLDGVTPSDRQRFFQLETAQVNLNPAELMTGDSYTLLLIGKKQEGRCSLSETYRLTTGLTAKAPFFRVIETPEIRLDSSDLIRVNKSLDCQRSFRQLGRIIDQKGQPLADVEVRAALKQRDGQLGYLSSLKSDANGRFEIVEAPTAVFLRLTASKAGFKTRETTFSASVINNSSLNQLELLELVLDPA